jgi:recombination protein RecT
MYSKINSMTVKDGEYKGLDKYTGEPTFEFITDDTKRENTPVIGYLAVFELKPEMGSYRKAIYFGREKTLNWAKRYSKAFDIDLYHKYEVYLKTGEGLSERELQKCSSPWYSSFDEMGEKTVLKQLIRKWGVLSVDMQTAFENDDNAEFGKPINDVFTAPEVTLDTVADEPKQTEEPKTEETAPKEKKTAAKSAQTPAPAKATQPAQTQPQDDDFFN